MEKNTKLKHTKILRTFFLIISLGSLLTLYKYMFGDYEMLVEAFRYSSLFLVFFAFMFIVWNIHLVAGDNKGKQIFDHLVFFTSVTYISAFSISFLDKLNVGALPALAEDLGITMQTLYMNQFMIGLLIPTIVMITAVWSIKNVSFVDGRTSKNPSSNGLYYAFLFFSLLGFIYTLFTPLYSIF